MAKLLKLEEYLGLSKARAEKELFHLNWDQLTEICLEAEISSELITSTREAKTGKAKFIADIVSPRIRDIKQEKRAAHSTAPLGEIAGSPKPHREKTTSSKRQSTQRRARQQDNQDISDVASAAVQALRDPAVLDEVIKASPDLARKHDTNVLRTKLSESEKARNKLAEDLRRVTEDEPTSAPQPLPETPAPHASGGSTMDKTALKAMLLKAEKDQTLTDDQAKALNGLSEKVIVSKLAAGLTIAATATVAGVTGLAVGNHFGNKSGFEAGLEEGSSPAGAKSIRAAGRS